MTPEAVAELIQSAPLPPGYSLQVQPQRKFAYRNLWSVRVFRDGKRVWGRACYPSALPDGIVAAKRWAWAMSRETA